MTRLTNDLNDMGYAYFDWNVSAADTASDATRYTVIENFKESVPKHDYSVVLQHDTNAFSVDAVEEILSWGIKNGYSFRALDHVSVKDRKMDRCPFLSYKHGHCYSLPNPYSDA